MLNELKLVISRNNKVVKTVLWDIKGQGFVKSIEDFQVIANATMTKLIEDSGESGDCIIEEDADETDNEDENICVSPKKRKK